MKKISIVFTVLIIALLSMLTACGKQADDPAGADGTSADAISSVSINGVSCRVDAEKNPGGQETGMLFSISIPKSEVQDETNVALTLELGSDWSISEDSMAIMTSSALTWWELSCTLWHPIRMMLLMVRR